MNVAWLPYELRRLGLMGLVMPLAVVLAFSIPALVEVARWHDAIEVARILTASVEIGLPLAAGIAAVYLVAQDPAIDLQLSVLTPFGWTLARRLLLLGLWTASVACMVMAAMWVTNITFAHQPGMDGQLAWISPLLCFLALGLVLALLVRTRSGATALLGGIWLVENVFHNVFLVHAPLRPLFLFTTTYGRDASFWLANRLWLIGIAAVLFAVGGALLTQPEPVQVGGEG